GQAREARVADYVAAGDRAVAAVVRVFEHRLHVAADAQARVLAPRPLPRAPAEVDPACISPRAEVDLLDVVLTDVADRDVAGAPIEREAPRVAQPVGVDRRLHTRAPDERVVTRDRVRPPAGRPRIDPQDLPEQRPEVLSVADRPMLVVAATTVADADVQQPVGPEREL